MMVGIEASARVDLHRSGIDLSPLAHNAGDLGHFAQFYQDEAFLLDALSLYIGSALEAGDEGVVIATQAHRDRLAEALTARGVDVDAARACGRYVDVDAAEIVARVMIGGSLDESRFAEIAQGVVERALTRPDGRVRIFGEVVALLCADAQHDAAVRLEELWNELVRKHRLSLFCAYPIDAFSREAHGAPFRRVCEEHAHVIPAESFTTLKSPVERLRAVSRLQQQVRALQTEAGERERAEESLRRTQAELSDFLDNAVEGMQRIAPDGRVLWANDPLLGLLGYTVAEYVGRRAAEFHASSEQYDALWRRLMHGETLCDYPADLRCGNGSIKRVLVHANARWDNGQFLYARCYIRDVTARRESSVEPGRSQ